MHLKFLDFNSLIGMVVSAAVKQAVDSSTDYAHDVSKIANQVLFTTEGQGLLNGPYKKDIQK